MKKIIPVLLCTMLISSLGYAEQTAPELILKGEDFTYDNYKNSINIITSILGDYEKGVKYDPDLDRNYIGIPNCLLTLEGYGLFTQRDIIRLRLENEKFKNKDRKVMNELEQRFQKIEEHLIAEMHFLQINSLGKNN